MPNKYSKLFVRLLYFIAVFYTSTNLGGKYIGISSAIFQTIFLGTVFYFFYSTKKIKTPVVLSNALILVSPLVIANIIVSIEPFNSFFYWITWCMFIVASVKIIKTFDKQDLEYIYRHIPFVLFISAVILYILLLPVITQNLPTKNSLGLLSGATLVASVSIKNIFWRNAIFFFSLFIVFQSDSRSSIFYSLLLIAIYSLARLELKYLPFFVAGLLLLSLFSTPVFSYFEKKMVQKEYLANNFQEALAISQSERNELVKMGWKLFLDRPILGYGLKTKYYEGRINMAYGPSIHVHNGYVGTLIETGIIISFLILVYSLVIFKRCVNIIYIHKKRPMIVWPLLVLFGFMRAYGESYLFFNIGNTFSILFVFLTLVLFFKPFPQSRTLLTQNDTGH